MYVCTYIFHTSTSATMSIYIYTYISIDRYVCIYIFHTSTSATISTRMLKSHSRSRHSHTSAVSSSCVMCVYINIYIYTGIYE